MCPSNCCSKSPDLRVHYETTLAPGQLSPSPIRTTSCHISHIFPESNYVKGFYWEAGM
jgi:hypothetical protein